MTDLAIPAAPGPPVRPGRTSSAAGEPAGASFRDALAVALGAPADDHAAPAEVSDQAAGELAGGGEEQPPAPGHDEQIRTALALAMLAEASTRVSTQAAPALPLAAAPASAQVPAGPAGGVAGADGQTGSADGPPGAAAAAVPVATEAGAPAVPVEAHPSPAGLPPDVLPPDVLPPDVLPADAALPGGASEAAAASAKEARGAGVTGPAPTVQPAGARGDGEPVEVASLAPRPAAAGTTADAAPGAPDAPAGIAPDALTAGSQPGVAGADASAPGRAEVRTAELAARVEAAVASLEHAPPPRRVVLELSDLGNLQLAVSLRGGEVHVQVVGDRGAAAPPAWLSDLERALAERGLSLGAGGGSEEAFRGDGGRGGAEPDAPDRSLRDGRRLSDGDRAAARRGASARMARSADPGGRLL